jgi:hypothetical protein
MLDITPTPMTDEDRRYLEDEAVFEEMCAQRAAKLGLDQIDGGEVQDAKEIIAELAKLGIKRRLYQARDRIALIVREREESTNADA